MGLAYGPDWDESLSAADPGDDRFEANMQAARDALQYDPHGFSRLFLGEREDTRVFTTKDVAAGYRVVIFFRIEGRVCVLLRVMVEDL